VQYQFDWDASGSHDYSSWTTLVASGHADSLSHSWSSAGTYVVKAKARDEHGAESGWWSEPLTVTISEIEVNHPPETPSITGPTSGKAGTEYSYNVTSTDPDGDMIKYIIDWGDDTTDTTEYYNSGVIVVVSNAWKKGKAILLSITPTEETTYIIKVKAVDEHDAESDWATLEVSMPKTKAINPFLPFLERLMERFPILERILSLQIFKLMVY